MKPLASVAEAIDVVRHVCRPLDATESVPIARANRRVLAQEVHASWDLPGADVSVMDGWAVRSEDLRAGITTLRITGESAAGRRASGSVTRGTAMRISTGAVVAAGADAVVAQEDTTRRGDRLDIDPKVAEQISAGTFIRPRGREVSVGQLLALRGQRLGPGDLALLAAAGADDVLAFRRPRVAILSTGDELVPVGAAPRPGQVVSSNGLMLAAMVREVGGDPWVLADVVDDPARMKSTLERGLEADLLVTSGGISVGDHDHVLEVLRSLGAKVHLRGLALRPGKPTTIVTCTDTPCLLLPGNPASTFVAFELLGRLAVSRRGGAEDDGLRPYRRVTLASPARGAGKRAHYVRARFVGPDRVAPLEVQQSGNLRSIAAVDVLVVVPPGVDEIPAEAEAEAVVLRPAPTTRSR